MKKIAFQYLMSRFLGLDRSVKKKIYIFAGILGVVMIGFVALATYIVFAVGSLAIDKVADLKNQPSIQQLADQGEWKQQLPGNLQTLTQTMTVQNCVSTLTGLLNLEPWLQKPLSETIKSVQVSCLGQGREQSSDPGQS